MKNQKGSVAVVVALVFAVVMLAIASVCVVSYISAFNYGNTAEVGIKAAYENNKNILAQYGQKVQEIAQVPDMYKDDLIKLTTAAIQGRYGPDGSKATMQWLKEQNPTLDSSLYKKIQQVIEAGRNDFQAAQTSLIDKKRSYETTLGSFWTGMWMRIAGYPKINLADYKIISTDRADTAFEKGKESGIIKLR
jgi:uncharacterized protein (UPF0333 family)